MCELCEYKVRSIVEHKRIIHESISRVWISLSQHVYPNPCYHASDNAVSYLGHFWGWISDFLDFWLRPRRSPISLNESLYLSLYLWQNSTIITLDSNNSAPDHLIELKFGTINPLRMYIMLLMSEQLSTAVISCQQLSTAVNSYFSHHNRRKSMLAGS